jgi:hypothetical protein
LDGQLYGNGNDVFEATHHSVERISSAFVDASQV